VIKPGVGMSSKVMGLDHYATSGETWVSKLSKLRPGGVKTIGKLPKFKFLEIPTDGIIGE
jgi:hypothetical protein